MQIYLARPIDSLEPDVSRDGYRDLVKLILSDPILATRSISIYAPGLAFYLAGSLDHDTSQSLMQTNVDALSNSDVVVVQYLTSTPSWGVPQEILMARMMDKPVEVLSMSCLYQQLPINLKAMVDPFHVHLSTLTLLRSLDGLEMSGKKAL